MDNQNSMNDILLYFSLKYNGDFNKIYTALQNKEQLNIDEFYKLKDKLKSKYTTILDETYPNKLRKVSNPPFVLYYEGDIDMLENDLTAIDGTLNPDKEGENITRSVTEELLENEYCIITKMNNGIASIVRDQLIRNNRPSVVVLGNGINNCYPPSCSEQYKYLKDNGLVVAETPFACELTELRQIRRNHLYSGLCDRMIITQAKQSKNIVCAIKFALDMYKDIFCIPARYGSIYNFTNELINNGCELYDSIKSIEEDKNMMF